MGARPRDDGQAVPLLLAVVALGIVAVVAAGRLCVAWADAARARTAADAAALACLLGGPSAATEAAGANGASVVRIHSDGATCTVDVAARGARASASAAWRVVEPRIGDSPHHEG